MRPCKFIFNGDAADPDFRKDLIVPIPRDISRREDLFEVLSRELKLPAYWGRNWDALNDVLTDLSWIEQRRIVLLHEDLPNLGASATPIYLDILCSAIDDWKGDAHHEIVVVFPSDLRRKIEHLLDVHSDGADPP
jgi:RNAse (barnase) inhibitor barstar